MSEFELIMTVQDVKEMVSKDVSNWVKKYKPNDVVEAFVGMKLEQLVSTIDKIQDIINSNDFGIDDKTKPYNDCVSILMSALVKISMEQIKQALT